MDYVRRIGAISEGVGLRWLGVSSFEISHAGRVLLLDPFVSRPPDARPAMPGGRWSPEHADAILVTHGHHDHFGDVPDLARRLGATVYLPADLHMQQSILLRVTGRNDEEASWRPWTGRSFGPPTPGTASPPTAAAPSPSAAGASASRASRTCCRRSRACASTSS